MEEKKNLITVAALKLGVHYIHESLLGGVFFFFFFFRCADGFDDSNGRARLDDIPISRGEHCLADLLWFGRLPYVNGTLHCFTLSKLDAWLHKCTMTRDVQCPQGHFNEIQMRPNKM